MCLLLYQGALATKHGTPLKASKHCSYWFGEIFGELLKTSDLTSKHARLRSARYDDADIVTRDYVPKHFRRFTTIRPIQSNIAVQLRVLFVLKNTRSALNQIKINTI